MAARAILPTNGAAATVTPDRSDNVATVHDVMMKLTRAFEHRDSFTELVREERRKHPHSLQFRSNQGNHADPRVRVEWRVTGLRSQLPPVVAATFGDFIQNLRSALEYMAWDLVVDDSRECRAREVNFPIVVDPAKWPNTRRRLAGRYAPNVMSAIEDVQPWHASRPHQHPLAVLQTLSNWDKHRLLNVVLNAQVDLGPVMVTPVPRDLVSWVREGPVASGDVIASVEWARPAESDSVDVKPTFAYGEAVQICEGDDRRTLLISDIGPAVAGAVVDVLGRVYPELT